MEVERSPAQCCTVLVLISPEVSFPRTAFFSFPNLIRWSYGGNRIQIKAECQLLSDVENSLESVSDIGSSTTTSLQSLAPKQDLLIRLLTHERSRLQVWLFPLGAEQDHGRIAGKADRTALSVSP